MFACIYIYLYIGERILIYLYIYIYIHTHKKLTRVGAGVGADVGAFKYNHGSVSTEHIGHSVSTHTKCACAYICMYTIYVYM